MILPASSETFAYTLYVPFGRAPYVSLYSALTPLAASDELSDLSFAYALPLSSPKYPFSEYIGSASSPSPLYPIMRLAASSSKKSVSLGSSVVIDIPSSDSESLSSTDIFISPYFAAPLSGILVEFVRVMLGTLLSKQVTSKLFSPTLPFLSVSLTVTFPFSDTLSLIMPGSECSAISAPLTSALISSGRSYESFE